MNLFQLGASNNTTPDTPKKFEVVLHTGWLIGTDVTVKAVDAGTARKETIGSMERKEK